MENAKNTLKRVAQQLLQLAEQPATNLTGVQAQTNQAGSFHQSNNTPTSSNQGSTPSTSASNNPARAVQEHQKLFRYTPCISRKRPRNGSYKPARVHSATLKFVCLGYANDTKPPSTVSEKTRLSNAGLGPASLTLDMDADAGHSHDKILDQYPLLKDSPEGYQLMLYQRGGATQGFHHISEPHLPRKLKDLAGQGQIYIKPLQNLIEMPWQEESEHTMEDQKDDIKVMCVNCGICLAKSLMENHEYQCGGGSSSTCAMDGDCTSSKKKGGSNSSKTNLQSMFPNKTEEEIEKALLCSSSKEEAVSKLLGDEIVDSDDADLDVPTFGKSQSLVGGGSDADYSSTECQTAAEKLESFRRLTLEKDAPPCRFYVSRLKGEFASDVLSLYKGRKTNLAASPLIRYEGELGVGTGPTREFFALSMQLLESGFQMTDDSTKKIVIFEGEDDHKLPIKDPLVRQTGLFVAAGKMIAHAALHGVPPLLYGISPAVLYYWSHEDSLSAAEVNNIGATLHLNDVPDLILRESLQKLLSLNKDGMKAIPVEIKSTLLEYRMEANLPEVTMNNIQIIADSLVLYNVIEKRTAELDDMVKGMESVNLISFLRRNESVCSFLFPRTAEKIVDGQTLKQRIKTDKKPNSVEARAKAFLHDYIDELQSRNTNAVPKKACLNDLLKFWTGTGRLPDVNEEVLLQFPSDDENVPLPTANTCFNKMVIPTKYEAYNEFATNMDIALVYGCEGFSEV